MTRSLICLAIFMAFPIGQARAAAKFGSTGLVLAPSDNAWQLRLGGRLHYDRVRFDNGFTQFQDQQDFRRVRLYAAGRFGRDWRFMADRDIGGASRGWKSLWVSYSGFDHLNLKLGQMVAPMGMEELQASNDTLFLERALPAALTPGLLEGAQASYAWKDGSATLGYFGNPLNVEFGKTAATGRSLIARVTWSPIHSSRQTLHFGLAHEHRDVDPGSAFRVSASPETGLTTTTLYNTSNLAGASNLTRKAYEGAWLAGPLTVQAEYMSMNLVRPGYTESNFNGWYVQASYLLTGERHRYSVAKGTIGDVRPKHGFGAVEVAVRRSGLDLEDGFVTGGRGWIDSVGLNWYLGRNFRFMANYSRSLAAPDRYGIPEKTGIIQFRAQVDY